MTKDFTLYHCANSRSFRVLWMLEEIGTEYDLKILPFPPRVYAKEYLEINLLGTVPFFIHQNVRMTESTAICHYLAECFPERQLSIDKSDSRYGEYLNYVSYGEATLTFPIAIYMRYTRLEPPERKLPQAAEDYRRFFIGRLRWIEDAVSRGPYLCGDRLTVADISVGYALLFGRFNGLDSAYSEAINAYLGRLSERKAFVRALDIERNALNAGT